MRVKIILFIILSVLLLLFNGCRKHSELHEDVTSIQDAESFFQLPVNASPQLQNLALDIKKQDALYKFIGAFTKRNGYPVWDKVISSINNNDQSPGSKKAIFFIPFKIPGGQISSYVVCTKSDTGYKYKLYSRPALESKLSRANTNDTQNSSLAEIMVIGYFEQLIHNKNSVLLAGDYFKDISISIKAAANESREMRAAADGAWETQIVTVCYYLPFANKKEAADYNGRGTSLGVEGSQICYDRLSAVWVSPNGGGGGNGSGAGGNAGGGGSGNGGIIGNYQCPSQEWWCESGEYRVVKGSLYTPDYYPGKDKRLPWLWWENESNYQHWLDHDISIVDDLSVSLELSKASVSWLVANPVEAVEIHQLMTHNNFSVSSNITSRILVNLYAQELQNSTYNSSIEDILSQHLPPELNASAATDPLYWFYIGIQ
ncbi:MAG TPA: hypothetical protein VL307_09920, partial [Chitinophagaceae bacterium]|nr:hypothetical protein [Chitinophagaceae bacterium]